MKSGNFMWVVLSALVLAALLHRPTPVCNTCAATAALFAPHSSSMQKIETYKFVDAATGKTVTLADLKGKAKAIYIDVFASWCGPCQELIPEVERLHRRLAGKGVMVVGVNVSDRWDDMVRDIQSRGITYPVLHDPGTSGGATQLLNVPAIPTIIILDGKTLEQKGRWEGEDDPDQRNQVFRELGVQV